MGDRGPNTHRAPPQAQIKRAKHERRCLGNAILIFRKQGRLLVTLVGGSARGDQTRIERRKHEPSKRITESRCLDDAAGRSRVALVAARAGGPRAPDNKSQQRAARRGSDGRHCDQHLRDTVTVFPCATTADECRGARYDNATNDARNPMTKK